MPLATVSPLDAPHPQHRDKPYFDLTLELLRGVRDNNFEALARICADDYGTIDITPDGRSIAIRHRAEWQAWFRNLFAQLEAVGASTDSEVLAYDAVAGVDLGYSVLEFRQTIDLGHERMTFDCVATIVWKLVDGQWRQARWHGTVLSDDVRQLPPFTA